MYQYVLIALTAVSPVTSMTMPDVANDGEHVGFVLVDTFKVHNRTKMPYPMPKILHAMGIFTIVNTLWRFRSPILSCISVEDPGTIRCWVSRDHRHRKWPCKLFDTHGVSGKMCG